SDPVPRHAGLRPAGDGIGWRHSCLPDRPEALTTMAALDDGFGGYLALFAAGFLVTEVWRWLGLLVGSRLDVAGEVFQWVRAVATALVAGMVTRMLLFPAGALADVPLTVRLIAF